MTTVAKVLVYDKGLQSFVDKHDAKAVEFCCALTEHPSTCPGRPIHALSNRLRRSVSHAQLMHDRGRYLQDRKRRLWLQELFNQVHTANVWDTPSNSNIRLQTVTWSAHGSKPVSSTKDFPLDFEHESTGTSDTLPQETNKEQPLQAAAKRKKRVCIGKWREGNKTKRMAMLSPCFNDNEGSMTRAETVATTRL